MPSTTKGGMKDQSYEGSMIDLAVQRCNVASSKTISQISSFWSSHQQRNMIAGWYALYFLFQAVMIPVICLRNNPQAEAASSWRDQIQMSILTLRDMAPLSEAANKCLDIIDTLCGSLLLGDEDLQCQEPTYESPQTQLDNLASWIWASMSTEHFGGENDAAFYSNLF